MDKYHRHEIMDRASTMCTMLDELFLNHPAAHLISKEIVAAGTALGALYQAAGALGFDEKNDPNADDKPTEEQFFMIKCGDMVPWYFGIPEEFGKAVALCDKHGIRYITIAITKLPADDYDTDAYEFKRWLKETGLIKPKDGPVSPTYDQLQVLLNSFIRDLSGELEIQRITCADGISLSVQASSLHYSTPRTDVGPYTHVEMGCPSIKPGRKIRAYLEGETEHYTSAVYPYVPIELIVKFIDKHGGIKNV